MIYETINNIRLINPAYRKKELKYDAPSLFDDVPSRLPKDAKKCRYIYDFDHEERERIFDFMFTHEKMSESDLLKLLGLKKADGFKCDRSLGKGIQGNPIYCKIKNAIQDVPNYERFLDFRLKIEDTKNYDIETGEFLQIVSPDFSEQPLYRLWHTLYSISDRDELAKVLKVKFGIDNQEVISKLFAIDFVAAGYASKSTKFMRKLIPLLRDGYDYSEACAKLGINHSNSMTKEENEARDLKDIIELLPKNSLRQPTVEKILNQMINLVNSIKRKYGNIDEVRVELARELKQSKEERFNAARDISKREKDNERLKKVIAEFGINPSRRRIQKMRMLEETGNKCIYCGAIVPPSLFIEGHGYEVEHIIPRSKVFDDSFSNKVCSCRECNKAKGNMTGFDFMESRSEEELSNYEARVEALYKERRISKTKRDNLLTKERDINAGFINRDLRLSQYISRKARLILMEGFRNVYSSSGAVTDFFRHAWGYDRILHDINFVKYENAGLTEEVEYFHNGQVHRELRITDWSKRKDHRHHSIDALVVALTRQGYVQRLSTLNAENPEFEEKNKAKENLDKWAARQPHFATSIVASMVENISVSFKAGKKLAVPGKRYVVKGGKRICVQKDILIPRGALHKDTIYGIVKSGTVLKSLTKALELPELIVDSMVRDVLLKRYSECGNKILALKKSIKKSPIFIDGREINIDKILCFNEETVVKYPIESITFEDVKNIVDGRIRDIISLRFRECSDDDKKFVQSLKESPICSDSYRKSVIRSVRIRTGIDRGGLAPVRKDSKGNPIGFAQTHNNHHLAFYKNEDGKIVTKAVSFWTAIKRKRYGIPIVVKNPIEAWDILVGIENPIDCEDIQASLPTPGSCFIGSMSMNEMFILGLDKDTLNDAILSNNIHLLCSNLFRVQKLSSKEYCFSRHTCTTSDTKGENLALGDKKIIKSYKSFISLNPCKVKVNILGEMIFGDD